MSDFFALQIGINYKSKRESVLSGCVNDITNTAVFWQRLGIAFRAHIVCSDESNAIPCTVRKGALRRDIIAGMSEIEQAMRSSPAPNKFLFFNFSGHGTRVRDVSGDEQDGMDEAICPLDYDAPPPTAALS